MRLARFLSAVAVVFACGGPGAPPNTPEHAAAICDELEDLSRQVLARCEKGQVGLAERGMSSFPAELCRHTLERLDSGRVAVDGARIESCERALKKARDEGLSNAKQLLDCQLWLVGKQGPSQPCNDSVECQPGLACVGYTDTKDGRCRPLPHVGDPCGPATFSSHGVQIVYRNDCSDDAQCVTMKDGGRCVSLDGGCFMSRCPGEGVCVEHRCIPKAAELARQRCDDSMDCGYWKCGKDHLCHEPRRAGSACGDAADCKGDCRTGRCVSVCGSG